MSAGRGYRLINPALLEAECQYRGGLTEIVRMSWPRHLLNSACVAPRTGAGPVDKFNPVLAVSHKQSPSTTSRKVWSASGRQKWYALVMYALSSYSQCGSKIFKVWSRTRTTAKALYQCPPWFHARNTGSARTVKSFQNLGGERAASSKAEYYNTFVRIGPRWECSRDEAPRETRSLGCRNCRVALKGQLGLDLCEAKDTKYEISLASMPFFFLSFFLIFAKLTSARRALLGN